MSSRRISNKFPISRAAQACYINKGWLGLLKRKHEPGSCLSTDYAMKTALPRNIQPTRDKVDSGKAY